MNWMFASAISGLLSLGLAQNAAAASPPSDPVASALSAAPAAIGQHAAVMGLDMKTLRKGDNGWTCYPDDPGTPGDDPMCVDANGQEWMAAFMNHTAPPAAKVGLAYMLKGGSDASNLDPSLAKPPSGAKWVTTGPHLMILNASVAAASGYPTGQADPDTARPYVMWGGTPYAHIMFPVK
jgi:hypothetical protein